MCCGGLLRFDECPAHVSSQCGRDGPESASDDATRHSVGVQGNDHEANEEGESEAHSYLRVEEGLFRLTKSDSVIVIKSTVCHGPEL